MDEKPVFVKIEMYEDIRDIVNIIKSKIVEGKETLEKLQQIRHEEESEIELWKNEMEDVEKKIAFVDKSLFG